MATDNSTTPALPKFTWLFLATYADPKALPTVLRTQADTEADARQMLTGDYTLTFAAKINTACPVNSHFYDAVAGTTWGIMGKTFSRDEIMAWGEERARFEEEEKKIEAFDVKCDEAPVTEIIDLQELDILLCQADSLGEVIYREALYYGSHPTVTNLIGLSLDLVGKIHSKVEAAL